VRHLERHQGEIHISINPSRRSHNSICAEGEYLEGKDDFGV
jgi:hypothetical protein